MFESIAFATASAFVGVSSLMTTSDVSPAELIEEAFYSEDGIEGLVPTLLHAAHNIGFFVLVSQLNR